MIELTIALIIAMIAVLLLAVYFRQFQVPIWPHLFGCVWEVGSTSTADSISGRENEH